MNYVSLGGTVLLFGEMFKQQAGIDLVAVPFQGLAPGRTALIRNDVQLIMDGIQSLKPLADEGRIRPLFFTASKRAPSMPGVPSAVEAGLPNFLVGYWLGILAPARTPRDIVAKLSEETARAVATPDLQKHWEAQSWETVGSTPEEFGRWLASERRALAEVMKRANISPQ
jgi:tripartite-type tricarboxylate transporter receptor subunit TctC